MSSIKHRGVAKKGPRYVIMSKATARNWIRQGIASSHNLVVSHNLELKKFKDIVDSLFHKMRKAVIDSRFQYHDRLVAKSNDPLNCLAEEGTEVGEPLQRLQLREIARLYNRLEVIRNECEELEEDCNKAVRGLLFVTEEL